MVEGVRVVEGERVFSRGEGIATSFKENNKAQWGPSRGWLSVETVGWATQ